MGVFTETVVPIIGNLLATAMLLSPFPAVLRIRKEGKLGDINPLPYPMTCVNAVGWVAYGYASRDPYVFPANIIGLLAGIFFTMTAFNYANQKVQDIITAMFIGIGAHIILLGLISCYGLSDKAAESLWGTSATVILMIYYVVPLSTMVKIVRTKNAASIYPPLAATAIANGLMWTIYGFAVADIHLWLPNLFGALIGVLQFVLRLIYGARAVGADAASVAAARSGNRDEEVAFAKAHVGFEPAGAVERIDSGANLLPPGTSSGAVGSSGAAAGNGTSLAVDAGAGVRATTEPKLEDLAARMAGTRTGL